MGIIKLTKYFNEYINSLPKSHENINSEICYIDYTSNLVITTSNIMKKYKSINISSKINIICNEIINTCINNLCEQIKNNKYFTKYIIVFDYRYLSKFNLNFKLSEQLLNDCIHNLEFNKDYVDSIPMIPKSQSITNTPISTLKENVRNLYELRIKGEITNYQNLYYLLSNETDETHIQILQTLINFGLTRYIVLRGAKNITRRDRNIKNMCKTIHNQKSFLISSKLQNVLDNINIRLFEATDEKTFQNILYNFKNTVNYTLIINLIPILVSRFKEIIKKEPKSEIVEFIGCENESDFVIRKHILLYNKLNCPTIYTNDSDLFMLLCDINCYIRVKTSNLNIRIKPNLFWQWLTGQDNIYLNDIIAFCCILGNDYNHFKFMKWKIDNIEDIKMLFKNNKNLYINVYNHALKLYNKHKYIELLQFLISLEIYTQCDIIENSIHPIERINEISCNKLLNDTIELKYRNIFTDNYTENLKNEQKVM